jgi:hypothetical protein
VKQRLVRAALVIILALAASAAVAQELDIFEINDFMDPRLRGATFDTDGVEIVDHGADFKIWRVVAGEVKNYDWRTRPSDRDLSFVHIVGSHYSGSWQENIKVTSLQTPSDSSLPRYRLTAQLARYMLSSVPNPATNEDENFAGRLLVTTSAEQSHICAKDQQNQSGCTNHIDYEIDAQIDTTQQLPNGRIGTGSLIVAFRKTALDGSVFRATYVSRLADKSFDRNRLGVAFDLSTERASSSWRMGAARLPVLYSVDVAAAFALNIGWTPSFVLTEPGRRIHNEVALFIDRKVYSKIIRHPTPSEPAKK